VEPIKKIKEAQKISLENAIETRLKTLKKTKAFKLLKKQVDAFLDEPYDLGALYMDAYGSLNSMHGLDLEPFCDEETEVIEAILEELTQDCGCFNHELGWSGEWMWSIHQCLGEPVIYNDSPERNHYAIYSTELDLRIDSVLDEEHGFLIIERAMRKCGVFENIVSTDRDGQIISLLTNPFSSLTDDELLEALNNKEDENE